MEVRHTDNIHCRVALCGQNRAIAVANIAVQMRRIKQRAKVNKTWKTKAHLHPHQRHENLFRVRVRIGVRVKGKARTRARTRFRLRQRASKSKV